MRFPLFGASDDDMGSTTMYAALTQAFGMNWDATETNRQIMLSEAVTLTMFKAVTTGPGAGNARIFTIRKNGADTAVTVTISGTATEATWTGSLSFAAGDIVSLQHTVTGTPTAATKTYWHMLANTTGQKALVMGVSPNTTPTGAVNYTNLWGSSNWNTTVTTFDAPVASAGNLTKLAVVASVAPGVGKSYACSVRLNNTTDALTATISDAATSASATGAQAVVAGDAVVLKESPTGTPTAVALGWCVTYEPTTNGETIVGFGNSAAPSTTVQQFEQVLGVGGNAWTATSSNRRARTPACSVKNLNVRLSAAPGVGSDRTIALFSDASLLLTTTITGTNTTGTDTSTAAMPADSGASGALLSSVPNATLAPAACNVHVGFTIVTDQTAAPVGGTQPMMGV